MSVTVSLIAKNQAFFKDVPLESTTCEHKLILYRFDFHVQYDDTISVIYIYILLPFYYIRGRSVNLDIFVFLYFDLLFMTYMENINWCTINNHPRSCISYYFYDVPLESTAHEHSIFYANLIFNVSVMTWFQLSDINVILVNKRLVAKPRYLCCYFDVLFTTCMDNRNCCNINNIHSHVYHMILYGNIRFRFSNTFK